MKIGELWEFNPDHEPEDEMEVYWCCKQVRIKRMYIDDKGRDSVEVTLPDGKSCKSVDSSSDYPLSYFLSMYTKVYQKDTQI